MDKQDVEYLVPESIEEAVSLRRRHGATARFIAGGTEVVPMMTQGRMKERQLIELSRLPGLNGIEEESDGLMVGAAVSLARLAIGSAGPVPLRVAEAEAFLAGKAPSDDVLARAGEMASAAADPREGSIRASPAHRHRVLKTLAARAIALAAERSSSTGRAG